MESKRALDTARRMVEKVTIKKLALEISKREAKLKQVNIAQISEILGCLSDISYEEVGTEIGEILFRNGFHRATKAAKKKPKKRKS